MEHEMETILKVAETEYGQRPEARATTIGELRELLDEIDGHLTSDLMESLQIQVVRLINLEGDHANR